MHIAIIQLAKELGVDFAFPSTTVTIENFPEKVGINPKYNTNQEFIDGAVSKIITQFEAENPEEEEKDF